LTQRGERGIAAGARRRVVVALLACGLIALSAASAGAHSQRTLGAPPRPVKAAKLDSALARVARVARHDGVRAAVRRARRFGLRATSTSVQVQLQARDGAAAIRAVRAAGGTVLNRYRTLIEARVPAKAVSRLASSRSVRSVQQPVRPHADTITDEAVKLSGAASWIANGTAGKGVTIAIVDLGFADWQAMQAAGELPADVITQDFCTPGAFDVDPHGTAVAEVVHDMAPGARLALVCVDSLAGLGQAKDWVVGKGIPIVNHSLGWFNTWRGDGAGPANTPDGIAADARARGVLWVNAAGNEAQDHWSATFSDGDGNGWQDFRPQQQEQPLDEGNSFPLNKGQEVCGYLKWDDWPASAQDYDLYLYRESPAAPPGEPASKPTLIASSTNLQDGTQTPTESICYTNTTSSALIGYDFAIRADQVTASPQLDLFVTFSPGPAPSLQYSVGSGSLVEPAASTHVLTVGAACWVNSTLEPFSAQGPTIDGRIKPDITAPDGISTATFGASKFGCADVGVGFFGTSAAAPEVAGAAALVKQANPAFGPSELQLALENAAIDVATPGKDPFFGSGILQLGAVPPAPDAPPAPLAPPVVSGKAQVGEQLTTSNGSWAGSPVFYGYQWQRCTPACSDIAGALSATYTPVSADVGATLQAVVTAYTSGGPASQTSAPTSAVVPTGPANTVAPVLSGSAAPGFSLTTSLGTWTGSSLSYSVDWRRCDTSGNACASTGVAGTTYAVTAADTGSRIRAFVTASNSGGSTTAATAPSSVVPPPAPANQSLPLLTGDAKVGSTLTASTGTWSGASAYAYHWWRCVGTTCAYVAGATTPTLTLGTGDIGATFRGVVTASGPGGSNIASSAPTDPVAAAAVAQKLALRAGTVALSRRPVGGGIFTARIAVARTDGRAVTGATVQCGAKVGRAPLHVRARSFTKGIASCAWVLPRWTSGKQIAGTVRVSAARLHVSRGFSARIR
jgi:subtilisin family serine protease